MNRAERRRKLFAKTDRTFSLSESDIKKIKDDAVKIGFEMSIFIPLWVLRNKHGFGAKRLSDFYKELRETWSAVEEDYIEINDIRETLRDEIGVDFEVEYK